MGNVGDFPFGLRVTRARRGDIGGVKVHAAIDNPEGLEEWKEISGTASKIEDSHARTWLQPVTHELFDISRLPDEGLEKGINPGDR